MISKILHIFVVGRPGRPGQPGQICFCCRAPRPTARRPDSIGVCPHRLAHPPQGLVNERWVWKCMDG